MLLVTRPGRMMAYIGDNYTRSGVRCQRPRGKCLWTFGLVSELDEHRGLDGITDEIVSSVSRISAVLS